LLDTAIGNGGGGVVAILLSLSNLGRTRLCSIISCVALDKVAVCRRRIIRITMIVLYRPTIRI
jgi:hypothetical protein